MMLDVQGLRTGYGRIPILNGIGFTVNEGEFVGILGHNGMGKTTLLRALMGFLPATAGSVKFAGTDVTTLEPYRRARLGLVLSTDPELILLDEPAAGMTHEEVLKTAELVREINRSKALIVVEHDMQFIRMIAKKVTVFNQGSVLVEDEVENIMRNPIVRDIYLGKQAAA